MDDMRFHDIHSVDGMGHEFQNTSGDILALVFQYCTLHHDKLLVTLGFLLNFEAKERSFSRLLRLWGMTSGRFVLTPK